MMSHSAKDYIRDHVHSIVPLGTADILLHAIYYHDNVVLIS